MTRTKNLIDTYMNSHWKVPCKVFVLVGIGNRSFHTPQDTVNLHSLSGNTVFFLRS